ncbi:Bet v I domain-containing protein [Artemisia annua]|uniref:Bet v I domain-containing protein n=1 Tax=Artemisia annua TaxID=35608 RepID=A0A2U1PWV2_ARTAN|nr:Bet v I domain-containing protein [Artemisia annua]
MALTGQLVKKVDISCRGHLVHEIYKHKPNDVSILAPDKVQGCDLISGEWGVPGSVILWRFMHDGEPHTMKEIIEEVDDENHKIVFKVIEADLLEHYKAFTITFHIEEMGDKQFIVWTIDFEKVDASKPDPTIFMDLLGFCVNDMDTHFLKSA